MPLTSPPRWPCRPAVDSRSRERIELAGPTGQGPTGMPAPNTANRPPPHPLIVGLTAAMQKKTGAVMASHLAQEVAENVAGQLQSYVSGSEPPNVDDLPYEALTTAREAHYTLVAGYLGGVTEQRPEMQVLYMDAGLKGWLL